MDDVHGTSDSTAEMMTDFFKGLMGIAIVFAVVCYIGSGMGYINDGLTDTVIRCLHVGTLSAGAALVFDLISAMISNSMAKEVEDVDDN